MMAEWMCAHKLYVGLAADGFTFCGALVLARDAFRHLVELQNARLEEEFRRRFSRLPLEDTKEAEARRAMRWAVRGLMLLAVGFVCQIVGRFLE